MDLKQELYDWCYNKAKRDGFSRSLDDDDFRDFENTFHGEYWPHVVKELLVLVVEQKQKSMKSTKWN